jgi:UPF0716 family protein affecting phage T7 exclusion
MASSLAAEWHRLRADSPGERFYNHYERARHAPQVKRVAQLVIGIILVAAGVVLCFIPGPGLLVMVFGFALLSSMSRSIARVLDRIELWLRRRLGRRTTRDGSKEPSKVR